MSITRRNVLTLAGAAGVSAVASPFIRPSWAAGDKIKVGLLLPYSGTYAKLGEAITNGMMLYYNQNKDAFGGRTLEFIKVDSEAAPPKAAEYTNKLVLGEKVDVLTGPVHSGVAIAMAKIAREAGVLTIISNAGANDLTGGLCAPNIFRSSFANGQPGYATGKAMIAAGIKEAVSFTWRYAAGKESVDGFKKAFQEGGGKIIKDITIPFPQVQFQSALSEIASIKPPAVYSFYAGGGAAKYVKDYAAAGLLKNIQLWGPGFLTDGVEQAIGAAGNGVKTALHYADDLDNAENKAFRAAYEAAFKSPASVYAVQGFDTMAMLSAGLKAVNGDIKKKNDLHGAIANAEIKSPRGPLKLSKSHNPVQNFYLRELRDGKNVNKGVAVASLGDIDKNCKMG
ncbi:MAG: ABC transporter substrate-binding protein [Beijerinckiaceae bacterium]